MRGRWSWICKGALAVGIVCVVLLAAAIYKFEQFSRRVGAGLCGVTVQRMSSSNDARSILVTYEVSCGATTPLSTQVSIVPTGDRFSPDEYPPIFVVQGQHDLSARWTEQGGIEIAAPQGKKIYRQETSANGIPVSYK